MENRVVPLISTKKGRLAFSETLSFQLSNSPIVLNVPLYEAEDKKTFFSIFVTFEEDTINLQPRGLVSRIGGEPWSPAHLRLINCFALMGAVTPFTFSVGDIKLELYYAILQTLTSGSEKTMTITLTLYVVQ